MYLNIKKWAFFILFGCTTVLHAQEKNHEEEKQLEKTEETHDSILQDDHYGIFEIGPYYPIAFGENFAHVGLKQNIGTQFNFSLNLFESPFLIGLTIKGFKSEVTDAQKLGFYTSSRTFSIGPMAGYHIIMKKHWRLKVNTSFGYVNYRNDSDNFVERDTGSYLSFSPSIGYQFVKNFGLYLSTSFRRDFLEIKKPKELKRFFNGASYFSVSLGLRIVI